jgi:ferric-dicitrate binding protein FerR (iron transport regulator)
MSVALSSRPSAPEMAVATPTHLLGQTVDPAFEQRWIAWRARGDRHEAKFRRTVRLAAIGLLVILTLGALGIRLFGGVL